MSLSLTLLTTWKTLDERQKGNRIITSANRVLSSSYINLSLLQLLDDVPVLFCHFFKHTTLREVGLAG